MFNAFFIDFFFIKHATVHNFADDNTLSSFAKTFDKLKESLESESECAIGWFTRNGMFVNPDEFKVFAIGKKEQTTQMKRYKLATKIFKLYNQLNYYESQ